VEGFFPPACLLRSETRAACAQSSALWQQATIEIMCHNLSYYCLLALHIMVLFFTHIPLWWITQSTPTEKLQQHPLLFTTNHTDRTFFVWRLKSAWPPHPGHSTILFRSETRAAGVQSFALWQQATIEIMCRNLSYNCLLALCIYNGVILHARLVSGESHNQCNATREVATLLVLHSWSDHFA